MKILFVSDYVCPYCLVAKEALTQALEATGLQAEIRWQPFELTPEPKERVDTWNDLRRRANYKVLEEPCRKLGLPMKLPPRVIPRPYTRLAFEGWFYACDRGKGESYNDAVYRAYFLEERDIGEVSVLADLAGKVGLDPEDFSQTLAKGVYTAAEKEAAAYSRDVLRPSGVPTLYLNGEKVMLHSYTREEMIDLLLGAQSAEGGFGCGEEGCQ